MGRTRHLSMWIVFWFEMLARAKVCYTRAHVRAWDGVRGRGEWVASCLRGQEGG